jgi:hypothetical protein
MEQLRTAGPIYSTVLAFSEGAVAHAKWSVTLLSRVSD